MPVRRLLLVIASCASLVSGAVAASFCPAFYAGLRWRMIGPFRGGRTVAASGVPGQPSVFYIGASNGGVWKSTDYGRVRKPVFDDQPTGSVGALAVAPSDPNVLYVGSGAGLQRPDRWPPVFCQGTILPRFCMPLAKYSERRKAR